MSSNPFVEALERAEDLIEQRNRRIEELDLQLADADLLIAELVELLGGVSYPADSPMGNVLAAHEARIRQHGNE